MEFESRSWEPSQGPSLLRLRRCGRGLRRRGPEHSGTTGRDGGEVDGVGDGCFVGVVCHAGFQFSKSRVELDEVGVENELDKAKVNIAG